VAKHGFAGLLLVGEPGAIRLQGLLGDSGTRAHSPVPVELALRSERRRSPALDGYKKPKLADTATWARGLRSGTPDQ
jgi:hypothetical protein